MDCIHFEKQEEALCAQHALNMLLQDAYFTASDLAEIASQIDRSEAGVLDVTEARSQNVNESGFFSVQVLSKALQVFGLELIPLNSQRTSFYRQNPTAGRAYICNLNEHWFVVRKLGFQWFILNSIKSQPELITDTYLQLFFEQLAVDGYTIFYIEGTLPPCEADDFLSVCPVDPATAVHAEPLADVLERSSVRDLQSVLEVSRAEAERLENADLKAAIEASRMNQSTSSDDEERQLQLAKEPSSGLGNETSNQ